VPAADPASSPGFSTHVSRLRRTLAELGLVGDEIAHALATELHLRPRAGYRYACGLSGQNVADLYNSRFGTAASPAPMSKTRISEYENWPIGQSTRRPSAAVLRNLAAIYQTTLRSLLDHHDLAALTDRQRQDLLAPEANPAVMVTHSKAGRAGPAQPARWRGNLTDEQSGTHEPAGTWPSSTGGNLIMAAARQAGDHSGREGAGNLDAATLEQLDDHVRRLARAYLTGPMMPLFGELALIRNRAYELLERTQRLPQRADLYLAAGQLSCLLAGTSCDLGYPAAAIEQARAARTYAELIGHPALWAYASGMLSTFFSLDGQHHRALEHARAGLARLAAGSAAVRLHSLEALAASRLGRTDEAETALAAAVRARDDARGDDPIHDLTGGMFTSTPAKHAYMSAMARTNLGQPQDTITEATRAIRLWADGPAEECAGSALVVTRIDIVTAHLLLRDLDAAHEALQPVLTAPNEQRTTIVVKRLDSLENPLLAGAAGRSTTARDMAAQIEDFRAGAAMLQLPEA
jgi:transcriptional regulator with XRE-family HTH domain